MKGIIKQVKITKYFFLIVFFVGISLGMIDISLGNMKLSTKKIVQAASNPYSGGYTNCTWTAWQKTYDILGIALPGWRGNAVGWYQGAINSGFLVGSTPRENSIAVWGNGYGHVAYVSQVSGDRIYVLEGGYNGGYHEGWVNAYGNREYTGQPLLGYIYLTPTDTTAPSITNVSISDVTFDGYTVTCNVSDDVGVTSVKFPSWCSDIHTGNDAMWIEGSISGNTASARVNISALKSGGCQGNYTTHIYVYDSAGNSSCFGLAPVFIDRTGPVISNVSVQEVDSTGYTVSCTVTDDNEVDRVQFPTWTDANGQDDLAKDWGSNPTVQGTKEGNVYTFRVNDSAHNYERGQYITHIYAYDAHKNWSYVAVPGVDVNNTYQAVNTVTWNNHTYVCYDDLMTWKEALNFAKALSGYLVTITSQEENDIVQSLTRSGKRDAYFIGLTDDKQEGHLFRWENGEAFVYTNWQEGEPNDYLGVEDCAEIRKLEGVWNDIPNNQPGVGFVIEIPQSMPEQPSGTPNAGQPSGAAPQQTPVSEQQMPNANASNPDASDADAQEVDDGSHLYSGTGMYDESVPVSSKTKKVTVYMGSRKGKKITLVCKKITGMTGVQIQYCSNKKFKKAKSKVAHKSSITIKKLKKKTYFVRVRSYKKNGKKKVYGKWSKSKRVVLNS